MTLPLGVRRARTKSCALGGDVVWASGGSQGADINSGGRRPEWSRTAHELIYQSGDQIMAASYTVNGDTFVPE